MRPQLKRKKRIVVKVGSSALVGDQNQLSAARCRALAKEISALTESGIKVVLVSSGAIAAGMDRLGKTRKPHSIPQQQALAATGQTALMHQYEKAFAKYDLKVAQVLLTLDDLSNRRRFLNARHTLYQLFKMGVIPIVNENDTVAVHEIKVGDNDNLAALITNLIEADLMINLSDVDGVFDSDPRLNPAAQRISELEKIHGWVKSKASDTLRHGSTGGMITKLEAAEKAQRFGVATVIANGKQRNVLKKIISGQDIGTLILPKEEQERLSCKKYWLAYNLKPQGALIVDRGARTALVKKGRSLLPSGVKAIVGNFQQGDPIDIKVKGGEAFARGLTSYSAAELDQIKGQKTSEIEKILGYKYFDEVIHRNDMVLIPEDS
ncbi:MAG: glutamate 5-kinase [bacterium]|nr:glutamate 5-kinase [bacterium]